VKQYSVDLRERLLRAIDAGLSVGEAARLFGGGKSTINRWRRRLREAGDLRPRARPGRRPHLGPERAPGLLAQVRAAPDATLAEHCLAWERATGVVVSTATMSRALARLGWPRKKSRSRPASGTRPSAPPGGPRPTPSTRRSSSSSTSAGPTPR
jgi:transposase